MRPWERSTNQEEESARSVVAYIVDKFVRLCVGGWLWVGGGGWNVAKCIHANIGIFSPQTQCTAILLGMD